MSLAEFRTAFPGESQHVEFNAGVHSGIAEVAIPGGEDRLAGAEREGAGEVHRVVATQCALVSELAGAPRNRAVSTWMA